MADISRSKTHPVIRYPAVAGIFYPDDKKELGNDIKEYLSKAVDEKINAQAIVVPHAGYVYSAEVAASAYKQIDPRTKRVFLLANAHSAYFQGIALAGSEAWQTPLGPVLVDSGAINKIARSVDGASISMEAHRQDHTLEVQLPFLQYLLDDLRIVPVLFGVDSDHKAIAGFLAQELGEDDLVAVSSDLSHYPAYEDAGRIDMKTLELIVAGNIDDLERHIAETKAMGVAGEETLVCGETAIKAVMEIAALKNWQGRFLKYANSGDAAKGDKDRVVGYGAIAFGMAREVKSATREEADELRPDQKQMLLGIARETVENCVLSNGKKDFEIGDERLHRKEGAFVTLRQKGELRGCIGQIEPGRKPLWKVVRDMAMAAALDDPRFMPVSREDLDHLEYEVSVLSRPKELKDWREIELGKHGVIISKGPFNKGVFLPQVAEESGWDLEEFLSHLAADKAGLDPKAYKDEDATLEVFTVQKIT